MWSENNHHPRDAWRWWQRLSIHHAIWSGWHRAHTRALTYYPWWQRVAHWFLPHERNGYKPHAVRPHALAVYSFVLIVAKVGLSLGLFLTFPTEAYFSSLTAQRIIALTNEIRAGAGIPQVREYDLLTKSADMKAKKMVQLGYFAHTSPRGESPWEEFRSVEYRYTYAGENLAMDFRDAEEVVQAWMDSPKHRENILNPKYEDIGIAVTTGRINGRTVTLVVQHFGASFDAHASSFSRGTVVYGAETGQPQVAAAATEARLIPVQNNWWGTALNVFPWVVGVFALWLVIQLILTIFVHVHIQHRGLIYATVLVIGLAVGLLSMRLHFLESIGEVPIVF